MDPWLLVYSLVSAVVLTLVWEVWTAPRLMERRDHLKGGLLYGPARPEVHQIKNPWCKWYLPTLQLQGRPPSPAEHRLNWSRRTFFFYFKMDHTWQRVQSMYQWTLENGDKRTDPWLLVYSPIPVLVIIGVYLCVVWTGPRLMKHRGPIDLKGVLLLYNFAMVCLSGYMFHKFVVLSRLSNYSYLCQPVDYSNSPLAMRMANVCWWFFFSKVIELSDTVFFILRKKNNQLSFLHIYHHTTMIFNCWAGVKYVPGGQSFFIGLLNSFVHMVMYSYYGLAGLGPQMQKYLWWKKYLTTLQLVQFVVLTTHTTYNLFADCNFPDFMNVVVFGYCSTLIVLFCNFYYKSYLSEKAKRQ